MRNKRGQFFGLYLVVLALMMCVIVVGLFYAQQNNKLPNSLVSSKAVLEVRDGLDIFEMREMNLIEESFVATSGFDFCSDEFAEEFSAEFIKGVLAEEDMKEFIFEDLTFGGVDIEDSARIGSENFFENILYSEKLGDCDGDVRIFSRASVGKFIQLKTADLERVNFPVDFSFNFERKYSVNKDGEVEKL